MKKTLTLIVMGLAALAVQAREPEYNILSQYSGNVPAASNTNLVASPFRLGAGGTLGVQVSQVATNTGNSNVIGTVVFSIDGAAYAGTGVTFTNALNNTTNMVYINTLTIPAQARWARLTNLSTTMLTTPSATVVFGQHWEP